MSGQVFGPRHIRLVFLVYVWVVVVAGVEGVVPIGNPLLEDFVGDLLDVVAGWIVG